MAGEWLKLRKQRSFIWATLFASAIVMAMSALSGSLARGELDKDPTGVFSILAATPTLGIYLAGLGFGFGLCVWLAREFASGSNYLTLLSVPRRSTVFSARLALFGIASVVFGAWVALIGTGTAALFLGLDRMSYVVSNPDFWWRVAATLATCVFFALLYFAAATLTRKSLPAVGIVVMLVIVIPNVAMTLSVLGGPDVLMRVLEYFPRNLIAEVAPSLALPIPEGFSPPEAPTFSPSVAGMLLAAWSVLFVSGAAWRFARQE